MTRDACEFHDWPPGCTDPRCTHLQHDDEGWCTACGGWAELPMDPDRFRRWATANRDVQNLLAGLGLPQDGYR